MIAVTGANGLLGSFIIRKLIEKNLPFVAIKRKDSDVSLLQDISEKIFWCDADILDSVALEEALAGSTHVIHTAAMVSFNPKHRKKIFEVNVQGTRNVVNACIVNNVKRLVHISSVAALGRVKGQTTVDENNKWVDSNANTTYAESKYYAELEVFRGQEEGLSTVILNPSVILAASDWTKSSAQLFKYIWDEKPFYINSSLNYVDVRDVACAAVEFLNATEEAERFILNAGSISFREFFQKIAAAFHKKPPSIELRGSVLKTIASFESFRAKFHSNEPLITKETARLAGFHFFYPNTKIKNALNQQFQSIDETIQWCSRYYIEKFGR